MSTTRAWGRAKRAVLWVLDILAALSYLGAIAACIMVASLTSVQTALSLQRTPHRYWQAIADTTMSMFGLAPRTPAEYGPIIAAISNYLLFAIGVILATVPIYTVFQFRRRLREQSSIRSAPVDETGVDDIRIMSRFYKHADSVDVFSGDFSWIKDNVGVQGDLRKIKSKVRLISHKSRENVRQAVGDPLFKEFQNHFLFDCPKRLKCSFVTYQGEDVFLFKAAKIVGLNTADTVCVLRSSDESRPILTALRQLTEQLIADLDIRQNNPVSGPVSDAQNNPVQSESSPRVGRGKQKDR
jgi:hypothetical protein